MTPEEHRSAAIDKAARDRNYGIKETTGGTAAIAAAVLSRAMAQGRGLFIGADLTDAFGVEDIARLLPRDWTSLLDPTAPRLGLGYDIATTTSKKSNPSPITLMQQKGLSYFARLVVRLPRLGSSFLDSLFADIDSLSL